MLIMRKLCSFISFILILAPFTSIAKNQPLPPQSEVFFDQHRWSLLYYYGIAASDPLISILTGQFHRWPEHIQTIELAYTLHQDNAFRQLVHPIVGVVQIAGNVGLREGSNEAPIKEFNPFVIFRWSQFPWNTYIATSLAIGEGVSYTSSIPALEKRGHHSNNKRLLNYLMLEATLALPTLPQWQTVLRIHHRSGAFGLYRAGNSGSNEVGLGIRYLFSD